VNPIAEYQILDTFAGEPSLEEERLFDNQIDQDNSIHSLSYFKQIEELENL